MSVIDLHSKTQTQIKLSGEEWDSTLFTVRLCDDNVYFLTNSGKNNEFNRIVNYNITGKKLKVAYETDQDIINYFLAPNGQSGFALLNSIHGLDLQELEMDNKGRFFDRNDRQRKTTIRQIKYAPDGNTVLVKYEDLDKPHAVKGTYIGSPNLSMQQLLCSTPMAFERVPYNIQTFTVKNEMNDRDIPVNYYAHPGEDSSRALFVSLQGGPHGNSRPGYKEDVHHLLSKGYNVLEVNYGGSTGFGKQFTNLINGDYGGEECTDIVNSIHQICQQDKSIDPQNIFITGGSYGGYLTVLLGLKYPELAKGLIAASGCYDWTHDPRVLENAKDKVSEDDYDMRLVPAKFIDRLKSPLLLIHGVFDDICTIDESIGLFQAAVEAEKPVHMSLHETDHFYQEWWVDKVVSLQAMDFMENLKNGTYQAPIYTPRLKAAQYHAEEVTWEDEL